MIDLIRTKLVAAWTYLRENLAFHTHKEEDLFGTMYCAALKLGPVALHVGIERDR